MELEAAAVVAVDELPWSMWDDPELRARSPVRWRLAVSRPGTASRDLSLGLAEFPPGAVLPLHHHVECEVYWVLEGQGRTEIDDVAHAIGPGSVLFIPSNAKHRTTNTGAGPLRFIFVFPTDSFEQVVYHFDE